MNLLSSTDISSLSLENFSLKSWLYWLINRSSSQSTPIRLTVAVGWPFSHWITLFPCRGLLIAQPRRVLKAYAPPVDHLPRFHWLWDVCANQQINVSVNTRNMGISEVRPLGQLFFADYVVWWHWHFFMCECTGKFELLIVGKTRNFQTLVRATWHSGIVAHGT